MSKKGFSFIELIIVVSILLLLAVIGVSISSTYKENTENTRISADIVTLKNSFTQFKENTQSLPLPGGNIGYYDTESNYMHSEAGAFGVHGFLTENILPKSFINYLPIDPRTHQYYAYGKTISNDAFEVSGVVKNNLDYMSSVEGNYNGEGGPLNLIREYNGPDFIFNESTENFPYNPEERVVTGKITSYSGNVTINGSVSAQDQILAFVLKEGDLINVPQNGYANIYFADGSSSTLGSTSSPSELKIAKMTFKEENNLFTKIQLSLSIGSLWTQAAKLDDNSEFEVYTTDTTAAVRGTIFSLSKLAAGTNITVESGKVKVAKLAGITSFDALNETISSDSLEEFDAPIISAGITEMAEENGESVTYIDASTGRKGLDVQSSNTPPSSRSIILPIKKDVSNNVKVKILSINSSSMTSRSVKLYLPQRILGAERIVIQKSTGELYQTVVKPEYLSGNILTVNNSIAFQSITGASLTMSPSQNYLYQLGDTVKMKLCLGGKCTRFLDILFVNGKEIVNVDTQTDAESRTIDACKFSFINPINGKCAINPFANELYELVGLADYTNEKSQGSLFTKDSTIEASSYSTSTELDKSDGIIQGIKLKDGKLNYNNLSKLDLGDNYIFQMRVKGKGIIDANNNPIIVFKDELGKYIKFFPTGNPMNSIGIYSSSNNLTSNASITGIVDADSWYDMVLFVNNTSTPGIYTPKYKLVISKPDGTIINSVTPTTSAIQNLFASTSKITLGDGTTAKFWKGTIQGLRFYKKIIPPKEGTNKDYIQRIGGVTQYIGYPSCTPSTTNVAVPGSLSVSCTVTGTVGYTSLNYTWTKTAGTGTPSPASGTITNFSLPITANITGISAAGTNTYKFEVSDTAGNKRSTDITVTSSNNNLPIVNAGTPQNFKLFDKNRTPNVKTSTNLVGTATDADGDTLTYQWAKLSGPTGGTIASPTAQSTSITNLVGGSYVYKLTANDGRGGITTGNISVTVDPNVTGYGCGQCPPGGLTYGDATDQDKCFYQLMLPRRRFPHENRCKNISGPNNRCELEDVDIVDLRCGVDMDSQSWSGIYTP